MGGHGYRKQFLPIQTENHFLQDGRSEFGYKTDYICGVPLPLDIRYSCGYDSGWHSNGLSLSQVRQTGGRQRWHLN